MAIPYLFFGYAAEATSRLQSGLSATPQSALVTFQRHDVEALLVRAIGRSRYANALRPDERDDLLTYLLEFAWKLSEKFDPGRGSFSVSSSPVVAAQSPTSTETATAPAGSSKIESTNGRGPTRPT